ncbi:MAG: hypothetical protein U0790_25595 [Isosphaeraceae bacterium]
MAPRVRIPGLLAATLLAATAGPVIAQQLPYESTPQYHLRAGDPYGMNYNWDYMRYGLPGVGVSPWNPIVQAQLNLGMRTAQYNMYNAWSANMYQAANLYNQQAIAQAIDNQRRAQTLEPRYDVRDRTPRMTHPEPPPPHRSLPINEVLSPDGKVLWPGLAPAEGDLAQKRAAAEAAILIAVREFKANSRASVQSVAEAKELLFAYGHPAILKLGATNRPGAESLLRFFSSLEQVLNSLAGV